MNGATNVAWALMCTGGGGLLLVWVIADRAEITRRLSQAGHILAGAGPWFVAACLTWACRGRSPGPAHPAAKALQGCHGCDACTRELTPAEFAAFERDYRGQHPSPAPPETA